MRGFWSGFEKRAGEVEEAVAAIKGSAKVNEVLPSVSKEKRDDVLRSLRSEKKAFGSQGRANAIMGGMFGSTPKPEPPPPPPPPPTPAPSGNLGDRISSGLKGLWGGG